MTLDNIDLSLIFELDQNSRINYSELSRILKISPETIRYRTERLIENQIIWKFTTIVDVSRIGFAQYKIFLKLQSITEDQLEDITRLLITNPRTSWVAQTDGEFDLGFAICTGSIADLYLLMDQLTSKYSNFITRKSFYINIFSHHLTRDYLINKKRTNPVTRSYGAIGEIANLDRTGLEIIKQLCINSRSSNADIAKVISNLTPEAIALRIKKLQEEKIITGHHIVLNHKTINQGHFKVFIYLNKMKSKEINSFINYCKSMPNVVYVIKTLGEWDCELDIEVKELKEYREVMMELTRKFPTSIKDYSSVMISNIRKYTLLP